jgi:hypothetical protein
MELPTLRCGRIELVENACQKSGLYATKDNEEISSLRGLSSTDFVLTMVSKL